MSDDQALFDKGMPIRRAVLGPEYVDSSMAKADEFMMSFQRATTAWAWGWAWGDPTLDRKTRSMLNLAMLTALGKSPEIKLHVKGALNNGISGSLEAPSAYLMKSPPKQLRDDEAREDIERFIVHNAVSAKKAAAKA